MQPRNRPNPGTISNNLSPSAFTATSSVQIAAPARDLRMRVFIRNLSETSGDVVYIGDESVTTSNGYPLDPGAEIDIRVNTDVYVITSGGNVSIRLLEEYITTSLG